MFRKKRTGDHLREKRPATAGQMEKGKVQGAVKVAEGKHRPANGPIFRGIFFSSPVTSGAYLYPQTDPYSGEFPFAGIYRRTKGDPRFFCGKRPRASFGKCVRAGRGNRKLRFGRGRGRSHGYLAFVR
ncbi:hypothetical protein B4135_1209 [Caldibacillus debilis]|uniref:Uncharacterized protein n=1 Tax=Caldibacillus debilis TaxID=301148 RepID=A0A150ME35_9BACI|nr:hypothetical protein B4135_1209 [Caldibacillus debilis]